MINVRVQQVPLFYSFLVSGSPEHGAERTWMLRLLLAGLRVSEPNGPSQSSPCLLQGPLLTASVACPSRACSAD